MREVIETKTVYTWETATDEIRERIRDTFHASCFYGDWIIEERLDSLKGLADYLYCELDYSISLVPDRVEFILMTPHDSDYNRLASDIQSFINIKEDCPLTGVYYDEDLRDALKKYKDEESSTAIQYALDDFLHSIHEEYEYHLSDEALKEHCEANEYEFTSDGNLY
jgi:hypothetical protein